MERKKDQQRQGHSRGHCGQQLRVQPWFKASSAGEGIALRREGLEGYPECQQGFSCVFSRLFLPGNALSCGCWIGAAVPGQELELLELQQGEAPHRSSELDLVCRDEREDRSWEERGKRSACPLRVPPSSKLVLSEFSQSPAEWL